MANEEMIETELKQYINDSEHLDRQDRYKHLKAIFDKHFAMEKTNHLLTMGDFHEILNYAKSQYPDAVLPMRISKREVYPSEVTHVLMIESVISYLNKFKLLRKLVKIDYSGR